MSSNSGLRLLHRLAHLYGVQTAFYDVDHRRQQASAEALLAVIRSLGAPVETISDVPSAWREQRQVRWQQPLEPVAVAWAGEPLLMKVRLPSHLADAALVGQLVLENGERQDWKWHGTNLPVIQAAQVEGTQYVAKQLLLPGGLPWGYHRFTLEVAGKPTEALIIAAPPKAYLPPEGVCERIWGIFLPLYALQTHNSWGSGDFSDLQDMITWCTEIGSQVIATLPLLPIFLPDAGFEPSPYVPVSRLLWNEFYLDITRVPELPKCPSAQALLASSAFQKEIKSLRSLPLVDYRRQVALKRQILEELCRCCFADASNRLESLGRFAKAHPVVEDYARFQATCERRRVSWRFWPQPLRAGVLNEGDYSEETKRYHLYVQWLAHQQFQDLSETARDKDLLLYLDLPQGVHPDGYDVWREPAIFAADVSIGAPPDAVFLKGQDWGVPPLHPEKIRKHGYQYVIAYLRHHLRHAGILRIDHVMGLHRLFWIPKGLEASHGVYVRYQAEEFYAILALESHRNKVIVVGEDLGTVPPEVRPTMARHGLHHMYVVHYELTSNRQTTLRRISPNSVASLNTHDMPPFAAFWKELDIGERKEALVSFLHRRGWVKEPTSDIQAVLKACLAFLSASPARVVLVNLEDLWLETQPQNVPGTQGKRPNWRRKARNSFEEFCQAPQVLDPLREIDHLRKRGECPQWGRKRESASQTKFRKQRLKGSRCHPR
ncbi:MAG: 4-alpha-glucanotransferase [Dehalococcoidia bacterium]|nr:4-alpha-glucanotransferase [Dehalococcoidia bacterium]